jgi:hypothetical protein
MSVALALLATAAAQEAGPQLYTQALGGLGLRSVNGVGLSHLDARLSVTNLGISSPLPPLRLVEARWALVPLVDAEWARLRFDGSLPGTVDDRDLYRARVGLANTFDLTQRVGVVAFVQLGLYSDLGGPLSGDDLGLSVMGLGSWAVSDAWSLGAGAGYVWVFGRPRWAPIVQAAAGLDRVEIDVLLPRSAELWWNASGAVWLGGGAELDGGFYRLHPDRSAAPGQEGLFQEYSRLDLGGGVRWKGRDTLILELTGALVPRVVASTWRDADTELLEVRLSPGWSVAGQVALDLGGAPRR